MKRKVSFLVFVIMLFALALSACGKAVKEEAQENTQENTSEKKKDYVLLKKTRYNLIGNLEKEEVSVEEHFFNEKGKETGCVVKSPNTEEIISREEIERNSDGKVVHHVKYTGKGLKKFEYFYVYDSSGKVVQDTLIDVPRKKTVDEYNDKKEKTIKKIYDYETDTLISETCYEYTDFNKVKTEHITSYEDLHLSYDVEYEYDTNERLISKKTVTKNGCITGCEEYQYDSEGNKTVTLYAVYFEMNSLKNIEELKKNATKITVEIYDKHDNLILEKDKKYGSETKYEYQYDELGNILSKSKIENGSATKIQVFEKEYDEYGNLIKEIDYDEFNNTRTMYIYEYKKL